MRTFKEVSMALMALVACSALLLPQHPTLRHANLAPPRASAPLAGLFDMFKETPEQKAAKDRAFKAQQEMLARRRDPELMAE